MTSGDILQRFLETGALLQGHFLLRSGLHSNQFFQAAQVLQYTQIAAELCEELAKRCRHFGAATVISPAVGGIIVGQEVGRALATRAIFAEKDDNSQLLLRRGFTLSPGEKVLIAEDVITRGGRVQQTLDLVRATGAEVVGIGVIVDRSGGKAQFDVPVISLLELELATYDPEHCPLCQQGIPVEKPGSK